MAGPELKAKLLKLFGARPYSEVEKTIKLTQQKLAGNGVDIIFVGNPGAGKSTLQRLADFFNLFGTL